MPLTKTTVAPSFWKEELLGAIHAGHLAGIEFLVTSRPDPKIVNICKSFPPIAVCKLHEVDTANVQNDIEKYVREALPELKDEPELTLLAQWAGGLFIYATTAVRVISPPYSSPSVSEMCSYLKTMLNPEPLTIVGGRVVRADIGSCSKPSIEINTTFIHFGTV
jgi:hypothetical protein